MSLSDETPLQEGHRIANEAEFAEKNEAWTKAMYKHENAAKCFKLCVGMTRHPEANRALHLLISHHINRAEKIRQLIGYEKIISKLIVERGYSLWNQSYFIDENTYTKLKEQANDVLNIAKQLSSVVIDVNSIDNDESIGNDSSSTGNNTETQTSGNETNDVKMQDINEVPILINFDFFNPDKKQKSPSKRKKSKVFTQDLINENERLKKKVKRMEDEISKQNNNINKIKSEFENKVINLRQNIDDLYQKKVEHDKLLKKNKKMNNDNNNDDVNEGIMQNENAKIQDLKNRIIELQKQQERHKIISMKQINDCKSKLNGWIKYSQQCKQMNEMLKSQLKQYAQIYRNNNNNRSNNNSNKISSIDQVYQRGTLSRKETPQ